METYIAVFAGVVVGFVLSRISYQRGRRAGIQEAAGVRRIRD